MKNFFLLVVLFFVLTAGTCSKGDCHPYLLIQNNSDTAIIIGLKSYYHTDCKLGGDTLFAHQSMNFESFEVYWERQLKQEGTQEFYFIDVNHYNIPGVFYDCDSILLKNTVLKYYNLTLEEAQNNNFTLTYP